MKTKVLGKTGMEITILTLGGMSTQGMTQVAANELFNTALDKGINYIDTSPEYDMSEKLIGNAISHRRNEYFLATKCGDYLPKSSPNPISDNIWYTKEVFISNIKQSLKLLKTDYIDLMQMHGMMPEYLPGGETDELILLLQDLQKRGIIRHIGCTFRNGRPGDFLYPAAYGFECMKVFIDWKVIKTIQIVYGALTRKNEIAIQKASEKGFGMLARGVLKQYTDKYDELFERAKLRELFEQGETKSDFLLRYALSHPGLTAVVAGTGNVAHLITNINAAEKGALSVDIYEEAKKKLDAVGIVADPF
jgi:aryl-alcohol dehydrogenase-like predicted oxidoreductase